MNLQVTKTLLDKLKIDVVEIDNTKYSDIENCHCNLFKFGRINSVLITNDKTLYSFFIYGLRANDFKNFNEIIGQSIFKIMINLGFPQIQFEKVLDSLQNIQYSKTSNRSVLSSMNDMKCFIESSLYQGDDIFEINKRINTIPYKRNKYHSANELFRELLS